MRISDWSSDVCSSDLGELQQSYAQWLSSMGYTDRNLFDVHAAFLMHSWAIANNGVMTRDSKAAFGAVREELAELQAGADAPRTLSRSDARKQEEAQRFALLRSEEHTSELQSLMRNSYAAFCLKKNKKHNSHANTKK